MRITKAACAVLAAIIGAALPSLAAAREELEIVGTGDGIEMLKALGAAYNKTTTSVEVVIPPSIGSGGGIAAVGAGKATLGRVARPLTEAEAARGIIYTPIARLPSAIFVHPSAGVKALSSGELAGIYAGRITNWKELGGADLRIRVVRREDSDSTLSVLRATMPGWKDLAITERSKTATSTQEAVETVRLVEGTIGFGPFTRALEQGTTVVRIDGHHPTDAGYPSSAVLALIHTEATVTPGAKAFLAFLRTPAAQDIIKGFGGVPVR